MHKLRRHARIANGGLAMATKARVFLDPDEIRTLDGLFIDATREVETIRARAAVGQRIHRSSCRHVDRGLAALAWDASSVKRLALRDPSLGRATSVSGAPPSTTNCLSR